MKRKKKPLKIYDIIDFKEEDAIPSISAKHKSSFDLAIKILHLAYDIFPFRAKGKKTKKSVSSRVKNGLLALYTQLFRLYRATIILCRSGCDTESFILLRSMLDVVSYLLYIAEKDHDARLEHYLHSRALSDVVAVRSGISAFPSWENIINVKWFEDREKEAIKYFKGEHREDVSIEDIKKKYTLRPDLCAGKVENKMFVKHYATFHRYASSITHGENLLEYIKPSTNSDVILLTSGPTDKGVSFYLLHAMVFIICAMDRINDLILETSCEAEIGHLFKELEAFVKEYNIKEAGEK